MDLQLRQQLGGHTSDALLSLLSMDLFLDPDMRIRCWEDMTSRVETELGTA